MVSINNDDMLNLSKDSNFSPSVNENKEAVEFSDSNESLTSQSKDVNNANESLVTPLKDENNNLPLLTIPDTQCSPPSLTLSSDEYINLVNNELTELKTSLETHRIVKGRLVDEKNEAMKNIMNV